MLLRHALGDIVRSRRQALGLTLRDVARTGQISLPYLSEVERGRKEASSEIIQAICGVLRLDLAELLLDAAVLVNQSAAGSTVESGTLNPQLKPTVRETVGPVVRPLARPMALGQANAPVRPVVSLTDLSRTETGIEAHDTSARVALGPTEFTLAA
jgi:transcriptional regulator with XRE-family HTH domain